MLLTLSLLIVVGSFGVVLFIVGRHWKEIRLLNPDSIREERFRQKRDALIEQRLHRIKSDALTPVVRLFKRWIFKLKVLFHAGYLKLIQMDRRYRQSASTEFIKTPSTKERIEGMFLEARSLARDLKYADAERVYLEILSLDERNAEAYKGLAVIYYKQKMYTQAKETYQFLMKLKKEDDTCYGGLGDIARAEGAAAIAEAFYQKALALKPRLPHWNAVLAEFYLDQHQPAKAWPLAKRASDLDPHSAKYLEMSLQASIQSGRTDESRKRYDRLRLLIDDRPKLDHYKAEVVRMNEE